MIREADLDGDGQIHYAEVSELRWPALSCWVDWCVIRFECGTGRTCRQMARTVMQDTEVELLLPTVARLWPHPLPGGQHRHEGPCCGAAARCFGPHHHAV